MPHYFFDIRDNDAFIEDDVGLDYPNLDAVKVAVESSLAELARNVVPGTLKRELAVEVRDEFGPVLKAGMSFEAIALRPAYTELNARFGSKADSAFTIQFAATNSAIASTTPRASGSEGLA